MNYLANAFLITSDEKLDTATAASPNGAGRISFGRSWGEPPARLLMIKLTYAFSFKASFMIFAISHIISESAMPLTILSNGKAAA
jgi:hypothetical protein